MASDPNWNPNNIQWGATGTGSSPTGTMQTGSQTTSPWSWSATPPGGFGSPVKLPADNQPTGPGIIPYTPGPITSVVNNLLTAAIGGTATPGPAQSLNLFSRGVVPPALEQQYQQNLNRSMGDITERMGVTGNRFGTDLSRTLAEAAGQANVNLAAGAMDRALQAISEILGLGKSQSSIEFAGEQGSLDRANQDFLASQQNDPLSGILTQLLGARTQG